MSFLKIDVSRARWKKSSYSSGGGNDCVEVASISPVIAVRDSKNPDDAALAFSAAEWDRFIRSVSQR